MTERPSSSEIAAVAAEWAVMHDRGDLNEADRLAFEAWIAADRRNLGAFARATAVLSTVRRAKIWSGNPLAERDAQEEGREQLSCEETEEAAGGRTSRRGALAFAFAGVASVAAATFGFSQMSRATTYRTQKGEIRFIPLGPGIVVSLDTQTSIRVRPDDGAMLVELQSGAAYFEIPSSRRNRLVVQAGDASISARQAAFSVRRLGAETPVEVTVRSGEVGVETPRLAPTVLPVNSQIALSAGGNGERRSVDRQRIDRELAWREGMLAFEDNSLEQAFSQFERYGDVRFRLVGPRANSLTVTGLYSSADPEGFARVVAQSLSLEAARDADGTIVIRG